MYNIRIITKKEAEEKLIIIGCVVNKDSPKAGQTVGPGAKP